MKMSEKKPAPKVLRLTLYGCMYVHTNYLIPIILLNLVNKTTIITVNIDFLLNM